MAYNIILDTVIEHCSLIKRGVKPMSILAIQNRYVEESKKIISMHDLYAQTETLDTNWTTLIIYKNELLKYIIDDLPSIPKTPKDHALLGYLCGYDTDSICEFIRDTK